MFEIQNVSLKPEGKDRVQILKEINLKFNNKKTYVLRDQCSVRMYETVITEQQAVSKK